MSTEIMEMPVFVYTWSEQTSIDYAISSHFWKRGLVPTGLQLHNCAVPVKWLCLVTFLVTNHEYGKDKQEYRAPYKQEQLPAMQGVVRKVPTGFEPVNNGFADRPLRPLGYSTIALECPITLPKRHNRCKYYSDLSIRAI